MPVDTNQFSDACLFIYLSINYNVFFFQVALEFSTHTVSLTVCLLLTGLKCDQEWEDEVKGEGAQQVSDKREVPEWVKNERQEWVKVKRSSKKVIVKRGIEEVKIQRQNQKIKIQRETEEVKVKK